MNQIRILLYILVAVLLFSLWQAWQTDYPSASINTTKTTEQQNIAGSANVPPASAREQEQPAQIPAAKTEPPAKHIVEVNTDVLHVGIDTLGGNIVSLQLLKYPVSLDTPNNPMSLLNDDPNTLHVAQSGLIGPKGPDTQQGQATYIPEQMTYTLSPNQNNLDVKMTWQDKNGLNITKIFTFTRGKYDIQVSYDIANNSNEPWSGQIYTQLRQKPEIISSSIFSLHTFSGASISIPPEDPYEKITFSEMENKNLDRTVKGGWLAMQQRYFLNSWIPDQSQINHYYSRYDNGVYTLGYVGPLMAVPPKTDTVVKNKFYGGPKIAESLKALAPHLDLTIDYGWLWPISVGIFWIMKYFYTWIGNWGWSIVLVTLLIKLVFYKLSETSYRSMAKMRKLTPRLQAIKERYGDDRQKMSQATMELYKKEKINPMAGCLPMVVQIPFFIALYYVLIESVELRQAPFILWIHDLSVRDPYFVLPILMGISMFLQQRLNPPPTDPMQAKLFMFLPIIFTVFFIAFPAGLVLYWLVNNCLSALQQWYIIRRTEMGEKIVRA